MASQKSIILHYHLFKNAGTSFDEMLKINFGSAWSEAEFPDETGNNSALVAKWIAASPGISAIGSHTAIGPLPIVENVRIYSVLFLRDPVSRIASAYRFERRQQSDTVGSRLARENDLEGYVRGRLAIPGDRQCRNFQVRRLAAFVMTREPELERARRALRMLSFVGKVEAYADSVERFVRRVAPAFPGIRPHVTHTNRTDADEEQIPQRVVDLIRDANLDDVRLLETFEAMTPR